ncbi:MAG: F0F1 ATP synthase subunit B family protein [Candidatus Nucleicultricaceae bacterium]
MPQFDINTFPSQIFWLFVCFFIVYTYTSKVTMKKMRNILEERWSETEGKKNHAHDMTHEAHLLQAQIEEKLKSSRESARKLLERASKEALTHTEHMKNEVMSMSRNNYRQAEARTLKRRDELIQDSKQQAHVLSKDIVKNILEQTNTTPVRNRKMKEIS